MQRFDPVNTRLSDAQLKMKLNQKEAEADVFNQLDHRQPTGKFEANARNLFKTAGEALSDKLGVDSPKTAMRLGWNYVKSQGANFQSKSRAADKSAFQVQNELNIREDQRNGNAKARQERTTKGIIDDPNQYGISALGGINGSYPTQSNVSKLLGVKNIKAGR